MNEPGDDSDLSFSAGITAYLRTRLQLVSIETVEALNHLKEKLLPIVIVLICAVGSYLLILAALVSFFGKVLGLIGKHPLLGWEFAALIVAGLHIGIIFWMKQKLTIKASGPLFEYSRAELERDREWIQEHKPAQPTSKSS